VTRALGLRASRLLDVARLRFEKRGWKNVHILCQDATFFSLPHWEKGEVDARGSVR
jgi:betaine lipid synthase